MKIKNKLLAALLIFAFIASMSAVVAQDSADISQELAADDITETIAADENDGILTASEDDEQTAEEDVADDPTTSLGIKVEVLDKNIKAGDTFRLKVSVKNLGNAPANNVLAGFSFVDLYENLDTSFKLVDDGGYAITPADGGYEIEFGFLDAGDTKDVILTFLATESGTKKIVSLVTSDDSILEPDSEYETTITVGEKASSAKAASAKTLHETGNPLALLAIALCCMVPFIRRK